MIRAALVFTLLAGSLSTAQAERYVNYLCGDGSRLSLIFETPDSALLMLNGGALRLKDRKPRSGIWFASPYAQLRGSATNAVTFSMTGRDAARCRRVGSGR